MMAKNGIRAYIPPDVLGEMRSIQVESNMKKQADALRKMAENSAQARRIAKLLNLRI